MKYLTLILVSLLTMGAAFAADHSVSSVPGGINLYSITDHGVDLVAGSPFVPNPIPPGYDGSDAPNISPAFLAINPEHNFVYALYEQADGPATLIGYRITEDGLEEEWSDATGIGGIGGNHNSVATLLTVGRNYAMVDLFQPETSPAEASRAQLYNQAGQFVTSAEGYIANPEQGIFFVFLSLAVDTRGSFYYVCLQSTVAPNQQEVSVYSMKGDPLSGHAPYPFAPPRLVLTSTDPSFVQSECH